MTGCHVNVHLPSWLPGVGETTELVEARRAVAWCFKRNSSAWSVGTQLLAKDSTQAGKPGGPPEW